jgi:hypothetical protein
MTLEGPKNWRSPAKPVLSSIFSDFFHRHSNPAGIYPAVPFAIAEICSLEFPKLTE